MALVQNKGQAAVQPKAGAPAQNNQAANAVGYGVIDNMEIPRAARGGARGSKYLTEKEASTIEALKPGQGFVIPFMKDVTPKRQQNATAMVIRKWAKETTPDGGIEAKFTIATLDDEAKNLHGIAVRRDA